TRAFGVHLAHALHLRLRRPETPVVLGLLGAGGAGKSTLFNALLNRERAVIDATPGTTRDALLEPLRLSARNGRAVEAMLVDLAGLDELHGAGDQGRPAPDHEAQRIAHDAIRQADLLLRVADDPHTFVNVSSSAPTIDLQTKADLQKNLGPAVVSSDADLDRHGVLRISAITGEGLDTLRTAIVNALAEKAVSVQADLLALQPRHEQAIGDAVSALRDTQALLAPAASDSHLHDIELLANTMRTALDALASLGGQLTPDEVIGRVFATFCVGK
ncbi:MAG: GTPase, partial [Phycisphaeraceae bacterium]